MKALPAIMPREDYIMPTMLPSDYTHRASFHENDMMTWQWFSSREKAVEWLNFILRLDLPRMPSGWAVPVLTHDEQGLPNGAKITNGSREFEWSKKFNTVSQRITPRKPGIEADYYFRRVGPQLRATAMDAVRACVSLRRFQPIS